MTCANCNGAKVITAKRVTEPSWKRMNVGVVPSTYEFVEEPCPWCTPAGKLIALGRRIYDENLVGCCWHVVLDDHNFDDESIEFCAKYAQENPNCDTEGLCVKMAPIMRLLTERERSIAWLGDDHEDYACGICGFVTIYPEVLEEHTREKHPH